MLDIFFFSPAPVIALCEFWHWKELLISCYCPVFSVQCSNPILAAASADQCQPVVKSGTLWTPGQDFKGGGMWQRGLVPGVRHAVIRPEPNYKTAHKIQCHLLATHFEGVTVMLIADTQEWQGETSASNQVQKNPVNKKHIFLSRCQQFSANPTLCRRRSFKRRRFFRNVPSRAPNYPNGLHMRWLSHTGVVIKSTQMRRAVFACKRKPRRQCHITYLL